MNSFKSVLVIVFILLFGMQMANAQNEQIEPIEVQEIQPKRNPFYSRPPIFFIYKKPLYGGLINAKINYWKNSLSFGVFELGVSTDIVHFRGVGDGGCKVLGLPSDADSLV